MTIIPLLIVILVYTSLGATVAIHEIQLKYFTGSLFGLWFRILLLMLFWPIYVVLEILYRG